MRFNVELLLENERIPKDKNRIIVSLMKHNFKSYDEDYYYELYENVKNLRKSFTFSLYMGKCKFLREEIIIPDKKMLLNFSTHDIRDGLNFYNAFLESKNLEYPIRNNKIRVNKINLDKEKTITSDEAIFKTLSPIVAREHFGDNRKTWYHSLNDPKGQKIFKDNLKYQLIDEFGEDKLLDINEIEFELIQNKEVKVKHYDIVVLANICLLKIKGRPYILDYLYKAGIGSQRSTGFGMVDLVRGGE